MPIMVVWPPVGKTRTAMLAAIAVSPQRVPYEARFSTAWFVFDTVISAPLRPSVTELEFPSRGQRVENFFALFSASEPGTENDVLVVFWPCFGASFGPPTGRQRLFQQPGAFSEVRPASRTLLRRSC